MRTTTSGYGTFAAPEIEDFRSSGAADRKCSAHSQNDEIDTLQTCSGHVLTGPARLIFAYSGTVN
jgi:hypothetical protein